MSDSDRLTDGISCGCRGCLRTFYELPPRVQEKVWSAVLRKEPGQRPLEYRGGKEV